MLILIIYFSHCYSKHHNMQKGHKHVEAAPICDKIVFNKVVTKFMILSNLHCTQENA